MAAPNFTSRGDAGLPTPVSGVESSPAFRPSPAPSEIPSSPAARLVPVIVSPDLLRIQPYLKYPGFELPEIIIAESNRGFAITLRTNHDRLKPPNLPLPSHQMPKYVSLQVEGVVGTAIRVLYANKTITPTKPQFWQKVQRVLAQREPAWRTEVTPKQICELVQIYARGRQTYLSDASNPNMPGLENRSYWRLLKTVDRWTRMSNGRDSVSDELRFPAKTKWLQRSKIHKKNLEVTAPKSVRQKPVTPADSDNLEPGEIRE